MNRMLRWVVYPNLWISLGASLLAMAHGADMHFSTLVFVGTMAVYNLNMLSGIEGLRAANSTVERHVWWVNNQRPMLWACAIAGGVSALLFWLMGRTMQGLLLAPVLIAVVYVLPLFRWRGRWVKLREVGLTKAFLIAVVWAWVTAFIPQFGHGGGIKLAALQAISIALFIFGLCIPFDVRDQPTDYHKGVRTLPIVFGVKKSLLLAGFALMLSWAIELYIHQKLPLKLVALSACFLVAIALVAATRANRTEAWYGLWLDVTIILLALALMIE